MRLLISTITALSLSACGSPNNEEQAAPAAQQVTAPAPAPVKVNAIGEVTTGPGYEFTLTSVEERAQVDPDVAQAGEGQSYIVAKFTFKNTGTKPVDNGSFPKVDLVDASGTTYSSDLVASVLASDEGGIDDLNPGVARRDAWAWKVAKGAFDPAGWKVVLRSDPPVEFKLK